MKTNPEKLLKQAWHNLDKKYLGIGELVQAVLFREGFVSGWNARDRINKKGRKSDVER